MDKVSSGGPLKIRADDYNDMLESAADYKLRRRLGESAGGKQHVIQTDIIKAKNSSGAARRAGDILQLGSSLVTTLDRQHLWLDGVAPAAPLWTSYHGVVLQAAPVNTIVQLQISGACLAYVNFSHADHRKCDVDAATYVLQSRHAGPYQVLHKPAGTGELLCVVLLGPKRPSTGVVKLTGALSAGSTSAITTANGALQKRSGAAWATANQTIVVNSWYATAFAIDRFLGVAQDEEGNWYLVSADCT